MKNALKYFAGLAFVVSGVFATHYIFASTLSSYPPVFETYLTSQQSTSDTTLSLANVTLRDGSTLSGYVCLTIDGNSPSLEYECGTLTGTTVAVSARGLDAVSGTTTITALKNTHRRGADVKITDYPLAAQIQRILSGIDTFPNLLSYASTQCTVGSPNTAICDKHYIDAAVSSGAANANETTNGISQLATGLQAASSTSLGSTAARLTLGANLATDTPSVGTRTSRVLMSDLTGYLKQGWINLTQLFTFTGGLTSTATTTLAGSNVLSNAIVLNTVPYAFPSALGASSTSLTTDASGNLFWVPQNLRLQAISPYANSSTNATGATTTISTITLPANTINSTSEWTRITIVWDSKVASNWAACEAQIGTGSATTTLGSMSSPSFLKETIDLVATSSAAEYAIASFSSPSLTPIVTYQTLSVSSPIYIALAGKTGNSSDTCFLRSYQVEILNK